jgi:hypothetical protein
MATVTITWTEPVVDRDGAALPASAIKGTEVTVKNAAGTNVAQSVVAHGATQTLNSTLPAGTYTIQAVTIDTRDQRGLTATGSFTVGNSAPGAPTNLHAVVS